MKECKSEDCQALVYVRGWCRKHYERWLRHGSTDPKIRYNLNGYIIHENICQVKLYDRNGDVKAEAIVDAEDHDKIKNVRWGLDGRGYIVNCQKGLKLHRVILGLSKDDNREGDHKDGNLLDNRKENLRTCEHCQNACNLRKPKNNTSGYKGVHWDKQRNRWIARIKVDYKEMYLGRFNNKIQAAFAYDEAAKKHHGEFARLNFSHTIKE